MTATFAADKKFAENAGKLIGAKLYPQLSPAGVVVRFNSRMAGDGADCIQRLGMDAIYLAADGKPITVEEKIIRRKYDKFFIELIGDRERMERSGGREGIGWIYSCRADQLMYAFSLGHGKHECWLMSVNHLRGWVLGDGVRSTYPSHEVINETPGGHIYTSVGILVPIADVVRWVGAVRYEVKL